MRITYIKHSGFLAEWENAACLFDWTEGELPPIPEGERLFVFASHAHADHFSKEIFDRFRSRPGTTFVLSSDIRPDQAWEKGCLVKRMKPEMRLFFPGGEGGALSVTTLESTDCGVAYLVNYGGRTVYHAGDLHWWAWPDDSPAEEKAMKNAFFTQIAKLKGMELDVAFLPLDPRLGGNYWMGFDALMRSARVKHAFPMHMWERYEYIEKLCALPAAAPYKDRIEPADAPGKSFELEE